MMVVCSASQRRLRAAAHNVVLDRRLPLSTAALSKRSCARFASIRQHQGVCVRVCVLCSPCLSAVGEGPWSFVEPLHHRCHWPATTKRREGTDGC
jgi:hypothetical protein